jgi:steroid 5-alpha reductase family enzyme
MPFSEALGVAFPSTFLILFIVSAMVTAIGFSKFVYFISVGYGLSVAALALTLGVAFFPSLSAISIIQLLLLLVYGVRLGGFLLARELKSVAYRTELKGADNADKKIPFFVKVVIWLACAFLYCAQTSPALYRAMADQAGISAKASVWVILGVAVMTLAVILESLADFQKSRAKAKNPKRFCDTGLFKIVRYPNYLAEILFWTGMVISGADVYKGWIQWVVALFGYVCIFYVMLDSTKRLEAKQNNRYGMDEEYKIYAAKTPRLMPLFFIKGKHTRALINKGETL